VGLADRQPARRARREAARDRVGAHAACRRVPLAGGLDALRAAKAQLDAAGIPSLAFDHTVTHSLYVRDPDGNRIELYVNATEAWRDDPELILSEGGPLAL
jgi:catechol 2,3-dioxygenase